MTHGNESMEVTVVIPNYNGLEYLRTCLSSLEKQTVSDFRILIVDNGSTDGSQEWIQGHPGLQLLALDKNYGFCTAVNRGIEASDTPYVILLNNDTETEPGFVEALLRDIKRPGKIFSCQAMMLDYADREKIDDAGDFYCGLGWAFARGKGQEKGRYGSRAEIFAACAGAAIYRKDVLARIGSFDERHFAYLEDIDLGYRAKIYGYHNYFSPEAKVYHMGSATTGSRYNGFKVRQSARNSVYLAYKNMPLLQLVLNSPLLLLGILAKYLFFSRKHLGKAYRLGIRQGLGLCERVHKVKFQWKHLGNYGSIQLELWKHIGSLLRKI